MKKWLPWFFTAFFALEIGMALKPRADKEFHVYEFGRLPALLNGRIQPLDSVGRNVLLLIRGNGSVPLEGNGPGGRWGRWEDMRGLGGPMSERKFYQFHKHPKKLKPAEWLLEVFTQPERADDRYVFLVHHPELLGELGLRDKGVEKSGLRYFRYSDLQPHIDRVAAEGRQIADVKSELRTPYQKAVMRLYDSLIVYKRLKNSMRPEESDDFAADLAAFEKAIGPGLEAVKKSTAGEKGDEQALAVLNEFFKRFQDLDRWAYPMIVPPPTPAENRDDWQNIGKALLGSLHTAQIPPAVGYFARMSTSYRHGNAAEFNRGVDEYKTYLAGTFSREVRKGREEFYFNQFQPFLRSMITYIVALLFAAASWLNWSKWMNRTGFQLVALGFIVHTVGLVYRMYLEGRPPVTNLYSSAIFVGWGAALLGLILERIYRNGIGTVTAAGVGFITLIIAQNLSASGDTMEMMRAVLDSNFWLATHVTTITIGYSSMFLAGFLAIVYILRGVLTRSLDDVTAKSLARMVYGIICFSTLFSFVGTILGGIWADQSWGRFWGWDPKENGALLIVLWCAVILHARWGGMIRERGLMMMAVFGSVVTAWSWFGVNMLGVGLHSYGFMDAAFRWLMIFVTSQALIIGLAAIPPHKWMSFRKGGLTIGRKGAPVIEGGAAAGATG